MLKFHIYCVAQFINDIIIIISMVNYILFSGALHKIRQLKITKYQKMRKKTEMEPPMSRRGRNESRNDKSNAWKHDCNVNIFMFRCSVTTIYFRMGKTYSVK